MAPNVNWGNVVTDPAEQQRIMGLATASVDRNEAGSGLGANSYGPGYSRDQALEQAAYSFFPHGNTSNTGTLGGMAGGNMAGTFTGTGGAPAPTPYGTFGGLDPNTFTHSPDYQYLVDSMTKGSQRGAAAKGTLLTGDFQKALAGNIGGLAAGDYGNQFNRELQTYTTNRDTNAQNYAQAMNQYSGNLAGFNANTSAALGAGNLGVSQGNLALNARGQAFDQGRTAWLDQNALRSQQALNGTLTASNAADDYARQVEMQRQQEAANIANQPKRLAQPTLLGASPRMR